MCLFFHARLKQNMIKTKLGEINKEAEEGGGRKQLEYK
jgi:hypothetical protein